MKKFILILLVSCIGTFGISAKGFDHLQNSEYAVYHDTRGDMNMLRTYWGMRIESDQYMFFIRNYDSNSGREINYGVFVGLAEGGKLPEITRVQGYSSNDPPEFHQSLPDLLNFLAFGMRHSHQYDQVRELRDPWDRYTQIYTVGPFYPLFKFRSIHLEGDGRVQYELLAGGRLDIDESEMFFEATPFPEIEFVIRKDQDIPRTKSRTISLNDYTLDLDENWTFREGVEVPDGYWLSIHSVRDSQITIEKGEWSQFERMGLTSIQELIRLQLYPRGGVGLIADSLTVAEDDEAILIEYSVYDRENRITHHIQRWWIEGEYLYTLNFSSFLGIFRENEGYYREIVASLNPLQ